MEKEYIGPYKVVKIYRDSRRREVLERGLSREDAKSLVNIYPNRERSIVVFLKQFSAKKYFK